MKKKFSVEITSTAESDMRGIWDFIAQDNMKIATDFLVRLEEDISTLERFPERCALIPENANLGTSFRHLLYGRYRTIFEIVKSRVIILRIIHTSRLLDSGMLEEPEKKMISTHPMRKLTP